MNNMEAGEREMRQAFEHVTTNNVKAAVEHSNETRQIVRELEKKVQLLESQRTLDQANIEQLRMLVTNLQTVVFSGGT